MYAMGRTGKGIATCGVCGVKVTDPDCVCKGEIGVINEAIENVSYHFKHDHVQQS